MNDWKTVNGERFDAESIARWFFQVDDRRQEECKKLILSAQKLAYQRGAREMAEKAAQLANKYCCGCCCGESHLPKSVTGEEPCVGYIPDLPNAIRSLAAEPPQDKEPK